MKNQTTKILVATLALVVSGAMLAYSIQAPPVPEVLSVTPSSGPTSGNTEVVISGANFEQNATVLFNGAPATVLSLSATQISALTPPHVEATVNVTVSNMFESGTLENAFTYMEDNGTAGACDKNNKNKKITVCHFPLGNTDNPQTICIGKPALPTHLSHGDYEGECQN